MWVVWEPTIRLHLLIGFPLCWVSPCSTLRGSVEVAILEWAISSRNLPCYLKWHCSLELPCFCEKGHRVSTNKSTFRRCSLFLYSKTQKALSLLCLRQGLLISTSHGLKGLARMSVKKEGSEKTSVHPCWSLKNYLLLNLEKMTCSAYEMPMQALDCMILDWAECHILLWSKDGFGQRAVLLQFPWLSDCSAGPTEQLSHITQSQPKQQSSIYSQLQGNFLAGLTGLIGAAYEALPAMICCTVHLGLANTVGLSGYVLLFRGWSLSFRYILFF